jgi:hypothetical protein
VPTKGEEDNDFYLYNAIPSNYKILLVLPLLLGVCNFLLNDKGFHKAEKS